MAFELSLELGIGLISLAVAAYTLVAGWLARRSVSAAFSFVAIGAVIGGIGVGVMTEVEPDVTVLTLLTEVTLALVLFSAASTIRIRRLEDDSTLVLRLLAIGLPLSIIGGTLLAFGLFPGISIGIALLIGAILAPTDADLGQAVVTDESVPMRIRRILSVESGLNDGIAAPVVTVGITLAAFSDLSGTDPVIDAIAELIVAAAIGIVIGGFGRWFFIKAVVRKTSSESAQKLYVLALALAAFFLASGFGGSGFIAAFVAGIVFGVGSKKHVERAVGFTEAQSVLLSILVWLIFGFVLVREQVLENFDLVFILYALLSLTLIRMVPVAIALIGSRFDRVTLLFVGWFGPRGLASIVFVLIAVEQLELVGESTGPLLPVVTWTVLLSVILHGFSARALATRYGRFTESLPEDAPELDDVDEMRMRRSMMTLHPPSAGTRGPAI